MVEKNRVEECQVYGIPVAVDRSMQEAVERVFPRRGFPSVNPGFAIAINPEKVIKAREDERVRDVMLSASWRFADGIGVVWALRLKGAKAAQRIPGCELWENLMIRAGAEGVGVFLVGARRSVLDSVAAKLHAQFQTIVVGKEDGYFSDDDEFNVIDRIRASGATIVTVAMGSPKQELFIERCRAVCPSVFYLGVGGTYDVFVGSVRRAPVWACKLNIEWLYRLVKQPARLGRQLVLVKYLWLLVTGRL